MKNLENLEKETEFLEKRLEEIRVRLIIRLMVIDQELERLENENRLSALEITMISACLIITILVLGAML